MNRSIGTQRGLGAAVLALAAVAMLLLAAPVRAAVYPAGGGAFNDGAEGWTTTEASCNVPAFCTVDAGYDGGAGNPPGSLVATANIGLNLLTLFKATAVLESPDFKATEGGSYALRLDRQFTQGSAVDLAPQVSYTVSLLDRTSGTESKAVTEMVTATSPFTGKEAPVPVVAGHTYAVRIVAETSSTVAGLGLGQGTTTTRFDNVALSDGSGSGDGTGKGGDGGNGTNGGKGANGLSSKRLLALLRASGGGTAILKGRRLFVKAPCPAGIGRGCRLSLQGLLSKRRPATTRQTSKVAKGKAKTLVLKVKPKARAKLVKRNRLLFKQTVKAGPAKATVYKRLKLIRR